MKCAFPLFTLRTDDRVLTQSKRGPNLARKCRQIVRDQRYAGGSGDYVLR